MQFDRAGVVEAGRTVDRFDAKKHIKT